MASGGVNPEKTAQKKSDNCRAVASTPQVEAMRRRRDAWTAAAAGGVTVALAASAKVLAP